MASVFLLKKGEKYSIISNDLSVLGSYKIAKYQQPRYLPNLIKGNFMLANEGKTNVTEEQNHYHHL